MHIDYFETSSIFVSPEPQIAPSKKISEHIFPRSLVNKDTHSGIDELELAQGINDMFFIGSWSWPGMPLLEGCVASAIRISERLGLPRPWDLEGEESAPWKKEDDLLERSLVERYLNGDLSANDPREERGFLWIMLVSFCLVYLQLFLLSLTKALGVRKALKLAYQPPINVVPAVKSAHREIEFLSEPEKKNR